MMAMNIGKNNQTNFQCENKQTNEKENNKYGNWRGQVLWGSAICLRSRAVKRVKASTNKSNECSEEDFLVKFSLKSLIKPKI